MVSPKKRFPNWENRNISVVLRIWKNQSMKLSSIAGFDYRKLSSSTQLEAMVVSSAFVVKTFF